MAEPQRAGGAGMGDDARPAGPSRGSFDFQALLVRITEELMHLRLDSGDSTQRESEHGQERECRVCRGEEESDRPLFYPCKCSGSIRYVHQDCLTDWLRVSGQDHCEVCKSRFVFAPVYVEGGVQLISLKDVMKALLTEVAEKVPRIMITAILIFLYFLVFPLLTAGAFRYTFCSSNEEMFYHLSSLQSMQSIILELCLGNIMNGAILLFSIFITQMRHQMQREQAHGDRHDVDAERNVLGNAVPDQEVVGGEALPVGPEVDERRMELEREAGPIVLLLDDMRVADEQQNFVMLFHASTMYILHNLVSVALLFSLPYWIGEVLMVVFPSGFLQERIRYFTALSSPGWANFYKLLLGYVFFLSSGMLAGSVFTMILFRRSASDQRLLAKIRSMWTSLELLMKVATISIVEFVLFPVILGAISQQAMKGITFENFERMPSSHLISVIGWMVMWITGVVASIVSYLFLMELKKVIRHDIFADLLIAANNPEQSLQAMFAPPITKLLLRSSISFLLQMSTCIFVLAIPVRMFTLCHPSTAPIKFTFFDAQNPLDLVFVNFVFPLLLKHVSLRTRLQWLLSTILKYWANRLGVPDLVLEGQGARPAPVSNQERRLSQIRVAAFAGLSVLSVTAAAGATFVLPHTIGMKVLAAVGYAHVSDLMIYSCGSVALSLACRSVVCLLSSWEVNQANFTQGLELVTKLTKFVVVIAGWYGLVGLGVGLTVDLVLICPLRTPIHQTPYVSVLQNLILGIVALRLWSNTVQHGAFGNDYPWKQKLDRFQANGFDRVDVIWTYRQLIVPAFLYLCDGLCIPFVITKLWVHFAAPSLMWRNLAMRYCFFGYVALKVLHLAIVRSYLWCRQVIIKLQNERYVVGQRLLNVGERS